MSAPRTQQFTPFSSQEFPLQVLRKSSANILKPEPQFHATQEEKSVLHSSENEEQINEHWFVTKENGIITGVRYVCSCGKSSELHFNYDNE